jgi:hypothetical protein
LWDAYLTGSSNPPTSGSANTNPGSYESGWTSCASTQVVYYGSCNNLTSDFSSLRTPPYVNHCTPTAGTNILKYWYTKNFTGYANLYDSNQWKTAFVTLYNGMLTTDNGTYIYNAMPAIQNYFTSKGYACSTSWITNPSVTQVQNEINSGYPFIFNVLGHYYYGNHSVVGVGYQIYTYSTGTKSCYILVADGWTTSVNRYVNLKVGQSYTEIGFVNPS